MTRGTKVRAGLFALGLLLALPQWGAYLFGFVIGCALASPIEVVVE